MSSSAVFRDQTAWFSESVRESLKDLWVDNGGHVCELGSAMFVFSEDAEETDTKSLFTSERYLCDCLAIFHASYVEEAVKAGSMKDICVGDYFLPPSDIYQKIKKDDPNFQYAWESWSDQHGGKVKPRTAQRDRLSNAVSSRAVSGHSQQVVAASDSPRHEQKTRLGPRCSKPTSTAATSAAVAKASDCSDHEPVVKIPSESTSPTRIRSSSPVIAAVAVAEACNSRAREERRNGSCHQSPSDSCPDRSRRRSKTAATTAPTAVDLPNQLPSSWADLYPGYVDLEELPAADPNEVRSFIPGVDGAIVYPVDMDINSNVR